MGPPECIEFPVEPYGHTEQVYFLSSPVVQHEAVSLLSIKSLVYSGLCLLTHWCTN